MHNHAVHHHIHKRKRIHQQHQPYPHPDKRIKMLDDVCVVFSVLMPLTTVPQIYKIYAEQNATGLSLLMWILYCVGCIPFLTYGIVHKEKPLIILNILWLIAQIIIIVGIVMYS